MSYGQNLPWGLQATRSLGASTWNGQTNPYLIRSGYPNNIFKGDPVVVGGPSDKANQTGYIISIYDVAGNTFQTAPTFGIFDGCAFVTPTATNPIDPASPGRQYWPSGTNTLNNVPAIAYVIDDPNTVFNVQTALTSGLGAQQIDVGSTFAYNILPVGGQVPGNTNTGQSTISAIEAPTPRGAGSDQSNMICVGIVPTPPNPTTPGTQYNNIEVLIQNHQYAQRAPARA